MENNRSTEPCKGVDFDLFTLPFFLLHKSACIAFILDAVAMTFLLTSGFMEQAWDQHVPGYVEGVLAFASHLVQCSNLERWVIIIN